MDTAGFLFPFQTGRGHLSNQLFTSNQYLYSTIVRFYSACGIKKLKKNLRSDLLNVMNADFLNRIGTPAA
jgi:hypothetical protein